MNAEEVKESLKGLGYFANDKIAYSLLSAIEEDGRPLLIEGDPGVGKTSLAENTAKMLNIPLIRISCYEGITADKILYDYDYQRQLLVMSAIREKLNKHVENMSVNESISEVANNVHFYGKDFLIERPVLKALTMPGHKVLLIDEIDKTSEEIEHALLETLSDFAITIPEYGTISCAESDRPIIFLTSNNYRELSDATKRRCWYLYIEHKTEEEIYNIITSRLDCNETFAKKIANMLSKLQQQDLKHPISISEGISWATYLRNTLGCVDEKDIKNTIDISAGGLAKNNSDEEIVINVCKS